MGGDPIRRGCAPVHRRTDQRVPEVRSHRRRPDQPGPLCRLKVVQPQPDSLSAVSTTPSSPVSSAAATNSAMRVRIGSRSTCEPNASSTRRAAVDSPGPTVGGPPAPGSPVRALRRPTR